MKSRFMLGLSVLFVSIAFTSNAVGSSKESLYQRYPSMSEEKKAKLIKKYVKRKGQFYVVSVSRYIVHTDISKEYTLRTAILMDEFYNKFKSVFSGRFSNNGRPKLYVLKSQHSYVTFLASLGINASWSAGMYSPGHGSLFAYESDHVKDILFHEGTHQLLHSYMGASRMPLWFNEGCATNFESWNLDYSGGENRKFSPLASFRMRDILELSSKGKLYSINRMFSIDHAAWNNAQGDAVGYNYASAWSVVNFLLSSKKNLVIFNKILSSIKKGRPIDKLITSKDEVWLEENWHKDVKTRLVFYAGTVRDCLKLVQSGETNKQQIIQKLDSVSEDVKKLADYTFYRGYFLCKLGDYQEAVDLLLPLKKGESEFPRYFECLGRAYYGLEDYRSAIRFFNIALKVRPTDEKVIEIRQKAKDALKKK